LVVETNPTEISITEVHKINVRADLSRFETLKAGECA